MAAIFKYFSTISSITLPALKDNSKRKQAESRGVSQPRKEVKVNDKRTSGSGGI
jgi:hypothetical protein